MTTKNKFCTNCGNRLTGNEKFCGKCGFNVSKKNRVSNVKQAVNEPEESLDSKNRSNGLSEAVPDPDYTDETKQINHKKVSQNKITLAIIIFIALVGGGLWGIYNNLQTSHEANKTQSKQQQISKNDIYAVKISKVTVGGREKGTDWILNGTTNAPDNATIIAILPNKNTFDVPSEVDISNLATSTNNGEDEGFAEVHQGKFRIEISPGHTIYATKYGTANADSDAIKADQDVKFKVGAIPNFKESGTVYQFLSKKVLNRIEHTIKPITLTTNQLQATHYRNWHDTADSSSTDASSSASRQTTESTIMSSSNEPDFSLSLTDFLNKYGMSPAAYRMEKMGMSAEAALKATPDDKESSGELQDEHSPQSFTDSSGRSYTKYPNGSIEYNDSED